MGDVDAEAIAQELVAKKTPLLCEEILQLAFYLPDQGQHKAAGERGSAFFAGAYRHGGITRLRASCRSWPWSIQAITRYIQQITPETVFTSFAILYDQEAKPHRDSGNEATPNVVIKLSDFQGGGLWIEDPLGQDARDIDGRVIPGTNTDFEGYRRLQRQGSSSHDARPHGAPVRLRDHRQRSSGQKAIAAGYQMKKSVVLPLITTEMHPGEAIEFALDTIDPFTQDATIDSDLQTVLQEIVDRPAVICDRRESLLQRWDARAHELVPESERLLQQVPDRHLRRLLRGVPDDQPVELGAFFHVALWRELLQQAACSDVEACRSWGISPHRIAGQPIGSLMLIISL